MSNNNENQYNIHNARIYVSLSVHYVYSTTAIPCAKIILDIYIISRY